MYDARFFRMWEFYLAGGIVMFENGAACNYQVQYIRERTALPITRDYMVETERRYRELAARARGADRPRAAIAQESRSSLRALELGDHARRRVDFLQRFLDRVGRDDDRPVDATRRSRNCRRALWMLPSNAAPITAPERSITGEPELPPMMSLVVTKS